MNPTRRNFLRVSGGTVVASVLGFDLQKAHAQSQELKIARTTETRSTCPYCSVSCGIIIHTIGDKAKNVTAQVVHVEGDPDHPRLGKREPFLQTPFREGTPHLSPDGRWLAYASNEPGDH